VSDAGQAAVQDIVFRAEHDGSEQRCVEILPPGFNPAVPHDALVVLHGHGSDRWQYVRDPRDECRAAREAAVRRRLILISPDYRATMSWMGPAAEADVVQILHELRARHRIGKVFLAGASMGGTASLIFAARHPDLVAGVYSGNGTANLVEYANFQDAIAASFGGSKTEVPDEYRRRSPEFFPAAFTMPVAITAGGQDTAVPPGSVLRLAEALRRLGRPVWLIHRPAGGHSTDYTAALDFILDRAATPP